MEGKMQTKKKWGLLAIAFTICLLITGEIYIVSGQEDSESRDLDTIIINNTDYDNDRKGPVAFPHRKHALDYKVLCWDCHHNYDDDQVNVWSPWEGTEKCIDCHDPTEADGKILKLQTAYHVNCKTCHVEQKIFDDDPLAYRKCTTCHEKAAD
jgi:hypothetical protein